MNHPMWLPNHNSCRERLWTHERATEQTMRYLIWNDDDDDDDIVCFQMDVGCLRPRPKAGFGEGNHEDS